MINENQDLAQTLLDAGAASVGINGIGEGSPFAIVPEGYAIKSAEDLLARPIRKRASITTTDATSFIDYLNKHSTPAVSTIYAAIDSEKSQCKLVAVLDDNATEHPQWRDHTCSFAPKQAVEWGRWLGKNKQDFSQSDFATWLEDNLSDVASVPGFPSGTEILQMALGFEANSAKRFRSKINLQSGGVQFEYVEDEEKDTRTKMVVFERFTLGLPVFDGSANAYPLEARLKYREKDGKVRFWFELIRPDRVFKTAVMDELANIKQGTGLLVISGHPGIS